MITYQLLYAAICVLFAYFNKLWIDQNKKIKHGWNGLVHLLFAGVGYWLFDWTAIVVVLLLGRVTFDVSLNLFRGLPVAYVSKSPKSIVDKIEKKIFKENGGLPKIIYLVTIVLLNILK